MDDWVQLLRDAKQEPVGGATPAAGDLEVRDLTFRYSETARRPALRDVTLTFARGRSYALIGRTGAHLDPPQTATTSPRPG